MNNYLIIGGNAVSGQETLKAIRAMDSNAFLISTSSKSENVNLANKTIQNIDFSRPDAIDHLVMSVKNTTFRAIIYIPARGTVGKPVQYTTEKEYLESLEFSVIPLLKLTKILEPERSIWFSGFMWIKPLMVFYGPMTYTKITMEELTLKFPEKFKCIRYGMFFSNSVRGISILAQKGFQSGIYPEMEEFKKKWKDSGLKFKDFFSELTYNYEKEELSKEGIFSKPFRPLKPEDIQTGIKKAIFENTRPILNVLGDWYWENDSLPDWPEPVKQNIHILRKDLGKYLL